MELLHQPGEIIVQRYRIIDTLGQGGIGITYQAQDLQTEQLIALKTLSLRRMTDWKILELFEREAKILSQLNHPAIPRYLNYFQVDTNSDHVFYIVQQLAPGKHLAALVESGWKPDESEVRHLAIQILEILRYLHELTPPIIHRDIKPENIIRQSDGQLFLVDFGAVQHTYHNTVTGGSTVAGTYGYMAPEQFRGQAVLSSDLYGLGTTLLFLLTQKSPADLPQRKLKIDFRPHVRINKDFSDWLEKMLSPTIEDRFLSAKEALAVLRGEEVLTRNSTFHYTTKHHRIALLNTTRRLIIEIKPRWLRNKQRRLLGLITLVCKIILVFLLFGGFAYSFVPVVYPIFSFPLWFYKLSKGFFIYGLYFLTNFVLIELCRLGYFILSTTFRTSLEVNRENFSLERSLLGICYQKIQEKTEEIKRVKLNTIELPMISKKVTVCLLKSKLRNHYFGLFLTETEQSWLVEEITAFLGER